jgi:hypothetical protein
MSPHEDLIRACKLDKKQVEQVRDTYEKAVKTLIAGGNIWHPYNDIETMTGLEGQFLWTEDLLAPAIISFTFDPNNVGSSGTYTLAKAGITVEQGAFSCFPNNPMIGWAGIVLTPQGGSGRPYVVDGMTTDDKWFIYNMLLEKMGSEGPVPPGFWAVRQM